MLTNRQALGDFKENIKSSAKQNLSHSRKGLTSRSLNTFTDSSGVNYEETNEFLKKPISEPSKDVPKFLSVEKENSKPEFKEKCDTKIISQKDDDWSDIEEMHIYVEPDDDYEDILPKCERIQKADIDSLFMTYTFTKYTELTANQLPSPLREFKSFEFPEFSSMLPEIKASLFDDTPLDLIPLQDDCFM